MTIIQNSFEGGSNGTTLIVSPNNTGGASGDAANQIAGSPTFSNAQAASGSLSLQMPASSVQDSFRWNSLSMTAMKSRFYLYYPTLLGADHWPWQACIGGGATRILTLKVTTGNKLQLTTPAGSVWTAAAAFSAGQWYRAEVYMNGIDTSTATVKVAYFSFTRPLRSTRTTEPERATRVRRTSTPCSSGRRTARRSRTRSMSTTSPSTPHRRRTTCGRRCSPRSPGPRP